MTILTRAFALLALLALPFAAMAEDSFADHKLALQISIVTGYIACQITGSFLHNFGGMIDIADQQAERIQHIIEIMRNPPGEFTECIHFLGTA